MSDPVRPPPAQPFVAYPLGAQQLYTNGFAVNLTAGDMSIVLLRDNVPNATVAMSFTTAKTLHMALGDAIEKLEKATGQSIMTIDVVQNGLQRTFGAVKKQ